MWKYAVRRILQSIPLVWGILTLTFFIMHLAPGKPGAMYYSPTMDEHAIEVINHQLGLDQPLPVQYVKWLKSFVLGDLGLSISQKRPVNAILAEAIPNTFRLTLCALILELLAGVLIGTISAVKQYSFFDHATTFTALFIYSMPEFWLALMLMLFFSLELGWLPTTGMQSFDSDSLAWGAHLWDQIVHLIMPAFCLGVAYAASTARYMRGSLLEVIRQDYIRTARAKGLHERTVIFRHAMKNALIPIVTLVGLSLPYLLGGAVIIERIFAWPGMGRVTVDAIFQRDYPVVLATTGVAGIMVVAGNLLADLSYSFLDPRIRYE